MKKQGGILENWFEYQIEDETVVFGESFNDPHHRFYQGQTMRSSMVCFIDRDRGILETYYTIYQLGQENTSQDNVFSKLSLMFGGYETQLGTLNGVMHSKDMSRVVIAKNLQPIGNHPINRIDELLPWNIDLASQPGDAI